MASLNQATVDLYQAKHPGEVAMAFCAGVKHAKALAAKFLAASIPAAAIYGAMPKKERQRLIEAHRTGEILVLTNDAVLREGYDVPEASVCFNLKPTSSIVDATQRGGRVTRLDEKRPDKLARVYDFLPKRDPRKPIILFAAVLGNSVVMQQHAPMGGGGGGSRGLGPDPEPDPDIPGIKVTYDANEVMRVTKEYGEGQRDVTPEDIKTALREQGTTAKDWLSKFTQERDGISLEVAGKDFKLKKIATVFGVEGNPVGNNEVFEKLCRAIWGDTEVDATLAELAPTPNQFRAVLKEQKITAKIWLSKSDQDRREISIKVASQDLKLTAIARLFDIKGNPIDNIEVFEKLCRAIWGDTEVDAALTELTPTPEKIRVVLKEQGITAKEWLSKPNREKYNILVKVAGQGLKLKKIAKLFGVQGKVHSNAKVFIQLCRAIWGDVEVDQALKELGKA